MLKPIQYLVKYGAIGGYPHGVDPYPRRRLHAIPARNGHYSHVLFCFALVTIFLFISFLQAAIAAAKESKTPTIHNPKVVFSKGMLIVQAKDIKPKALMEEIGKKAGIEVSIAGNLQKNGIVGNSF